jgi:hypothetical protein
MLAFLKIFAELSVAINLRNRKFHSLVHYKVALPPAVRMPSQTPKMSKYAIQGKYVAEEDLEGLLKKLFGEGDYRISVGSPFRKESLTICLANIPPSRMLHSPKMTDSDIMRRGN